MRRRGGAAIVELGGDDVALARRQRAGFEVRREIADGAPLGRQLEVDREALDRAGAVGKDEVVVEPPA
jgi:hypothetical protein